MELKPLKNYSLRTAMTLVLALLTATTAWADLTCKANPTEGGSVEVDPNNSTYVFVTANDGYYSNSLAWYDADSNGGGTVTSVVLNEEMGDYDVQVTFNKSGHGTAPAAQNLRLGDKVTRPDDPTADGYIFLGWYTNGICTNPYDFDTVLDNTLTYNTADDRYTLTLYAKWAELGTCGKTTSDDVKWYVTNSTSSIDDVLTIFGSGAMADYSNTARPWYSYRGQIKTIVIGEGVTYISNNAFNNFINVTSAITIPASVTSTGQAVFGYVSSNTAAGIHITAAEGSLLTNIGRYTFTNTNASIDLSRCTHLTAISNTTVFTLTTKEVTLPSSVTSICQYAFSRYASYSFLGDHVYIVVPDGKALSVTIDGVADPTVITSTEGKADIIGCLYADPANRAESRALTLTIVDADPSSEQPTVTIATPEHGTVSYSLNGQERTLTVKPDAGYYIRKSDITVQKTIAPNQATARNMVPVADNLELEGTDDPVQSETAYTFTIPAGYDAYVTATFTACTVPELSVSIEGWTFGETPNEPTVSGNDGDAAVTYTYAAKGSDDFSADVPSAIGEYTVKASVPAIGIYTSKEATADFSIAAYTETISFAASQTWKGYYSEKALSLPDGVKAYVITALTATEATATEVGFIPKDEPVLLNRTAEEVAEYTATLYSGSETAPEGNLLKVDATDKTVNVGEIYVLYNNEFVLASSGTLPAGRVYLEASGMSAARLAVVMSTTSIDNLQLTIDNDQWYTLDGRKLGGKPAARGIYIHNGKKVIK